jgi:hypothetical protein
MRVADDWGGVQGPRDGHGLPRADEGGYACAPRVGFGAAFGCLLLLGAGLPAAALCERTARGSQASR